MKRRHYNLKVKYGVKQPHDDIYTVKTLRVKIDSTVIGVLFRTIGVLVRYIYITFSSFNNSSVKLQNLWKYPVYSAGIYDS